MSNRNFQPFSHAYAQPLAGPGDMERAKAKLLARVKVSRGTVSGESGEPHIAPEHLSGRLPDGAKPSPLSPPVEGSSGAREAGTGQAASTASSSAVPPAAAPLSWEKPKPYEPGVARAFDTTHRYRVDILTCKGETTYTCWALGAAAGGLNERLGMTDTPEAAKAVCAAHNASGDIVSENLSTTGDSK